MRQPTPYKVEWQAEQRRRIAIEERYHTAMAEVERLSGELKAAPSRVVRVPVPAADVAKDLGGTNKDKIKALESAVAYLSERLRASGVEVDLAWLSR